MKMEHMTIIFLIIILPIMLVLANYTSSRISTLRMQISYDQKLDNATTDAVLAYQMNTFNGDESIFANYKIENVEAAVNAFYTSVRNNFGMSGYNNKSIQEFVPAIVFMLYDGYYIYSAYQNTWDQETIDRSNAYGSESDRTYNGELPDKKDRDRLFGLKPYVYYSCRYIYNNLDIVITYSLDNYITIEGVNTSTGEAINQKGYLLSGVDRDASGNYTYNGTTITSEGTIYETLGLEDANNDGVLDLKAYAVRKLNGTKYYLDPDTGKVFSFLNGVKQDAAAVTPEQITDNDNAVEYYAEAYNLKTFIEGNLLGLRTSNAVLIGNENEDGTIETVNASDVFGDYPIFEELESRYNNDNQTCIEEEDSYFNSHRMDVIKYTVERNLSIAITNFNNVSSASANFRMPELMDDEWATITNDVSVISFLQGLPIGSKIYNGYSIITNNKNKELVSDDDIYIVTTDGTYHDIRDSDLYVTGSGSLTIQSGRYDMDFERETLIGEDQTNYYYFPAFIQNQRPTLLTACYGSLVTRRNIVSESIFDAVKDARNELKSVYYTALGRERFGMYRVENSSDMSTY